MKPPNEEHSPAPGERGEGESRTPRHLGDLHKTITMAQIAKAAGVSQGAISSLLNDRDYGIRVSDKTRERVFRVCREMGYIPNDLRAVVRMYPELGEFCLLIGTDSTRGVSDPFVARIVHAAMTAINDPSHPITIAFYDKATDYGRDHENLPYPVRSGVASKFLFHGPRNVSLMQQILRRGLPVINIGSDVPLPGVLNLMPDYLMASRVAIDYLFKLGHQHIGIVSGPFGTNDTQIIELHRGVKAAYDALGTPIEAQNIVYGDLSYQAGVAALDELLTHPLKPTAVFCLGDAAAAGVLAQAQARGIKIPSGLSVVGCSDDACAQYSLPQLTTVHIPAEEMSQIGVKEIDRLVHAGATVGVEKRILPVKLTERGSTAAPSA